MATNHSPVCEKSQITSGFVQHLCGAIETTQTNNKQRKGNEGLGMPPLGYFFSPRPYLLLPAVLPSFQRSFVSRSHGAPGLGCQAVAGRPRRLSDSIRDSGRSRRSREPGTDSTVVVPPVG